jgi:hypothetical protein
VADDGGTRASATSAPPPPTALDFFTLTPSRLLDTRLAGGPLSAGTERTIAIAGECGIPAAAVAVSLNVTVTQPTAPGNLRLYPAGSAVPSTSTVNYAAGQTRADNAVVGLGAGGRLAALNQPAGQTHLVVDANGCFLEAQQGCIDGDGDGWTDCTRTSTTAGRR